MSHGPGYAPRAPDDRIAPTCVATAVTDVPMWATLEHMYEEGRAPDHTVPQGTAVRMQNDITHQRPGVGEFVYGYMVDKHAPSFTMGYMPLRTDQRGGTVRHFDMFRP